MVFMRKYSVKLELFKHHMQLKLAPIDIIPGEYIMHSVEKRWAF